MLATSESERFMLACNIDCGMAMAAVAAAIADVTRSRMLCALLDGRALVAGELAVVAETSPQNASNHLQALLSQGLVRVHKQGRHRYYSLPDALVAHAVESLLVVAGPSIVTESPKRSRRLEAWRFARSCYDHLAGRLALEIVRSLLAQAVLIETNDGYDLGPRGETWLCEIGLSAAAVRTRQRTFARQCMDWTERRPHIAGALGAALLQTFLDRDWLRRSKASRQLVTTAEGERQVRSLFRIRAPRIEAAAESGC